MACGSSVTPTSAMSDVTAASRCKRWGAESENHSSASMGTSATLAKLGYVVVELDAGEWHTTQEALIAFGRALQFPDYYGRNVNALVDCMHDIATYDYGSDPTAAGTVIALDHYDTFTEHDPQLAWTLLEVLADTARQALLIGHRFLVLARSADPDLSLPAVGATPVTWNRQEFMRSRRG